MARPLSQLPSPFKRWNRSLIFFPSSIIWGWVFEQLIAHTKRRLRKITGQAKFSHFELLTAITEMEMVLSSRPLLYASANDLEKPLTLSIWLWGKDLWMFQTILAESLSILKWPLMVSLSEPDTSPLLSTYFGRVEERVLGKAKGGTWPAQEEFPCTAFISGWCCDCPQWQPTQGHVEASRVKSLLTGPNSASKAAVLWVAG